MKIKTFFILFAALFVQSLPGYSASASTSDATSVRVSFAISEDVCKLFNRTLKAEAEAEIKLILQIELFDSQKSRIASFNQPLNRSKIESGGYSDRVDLGTIPISTKDSLSSALSLDTSSGTSFFYEPRIIRFWDGTSVYHHSIDEGPAQEHKTPITNDVTGRVLQSLCLNIVLTKPKAITHEHFWGISTTTSQYLVHTVVTSDTDDHPCTIS